MTIKIAVVGAGLSSAIVCHQLKDLAQITVFEKARGIGGRLSRHYQNGYVTDLGAQDIIISDLTHSSIINHSVKAGVLHPWQPRFLVGNNQEKKLIDLNTTDCFCGHGSMNAWVKWLLRDTEVVFQSRIHDIVKKDSGYMLETEAHHSFGSFDIVVITCPAPQVIDLVPSLANTLQNIEYSSCLIVNLGLSGKLPPSVPDVIKSEETLCRWLIQAHQKPYSESKPALTLQSKPLDYQTASQEKESLCQQMINDAKAIYDCPFDIEYRHQHLWRYSQCLNPITGHYLLQDNIAVIGDAFNPKGQSPLEACIDNAVSLSEKIKTLTIVGH